MSILRDFERRLEGAVEGFFARAFRSGLQPVELAKALQRYPSNYQQVGLDGVVVPNVYRFTLAPGDLERFGGYVNALQRELADVVARTSAERGWQLKGKVRIEFTPGEQVKVGTFELRGKIEATAPEASGHAATGTAAGGAAAEASGAGSEAAAPAPVGPSPLGARAGDTRVLQARPAHATLRALDGALDGALEPIRIDAETTIGRLPECDVRLRDPSVSRRHARIVPLHGRWTIEDLGSTNGVKVNGTAVGSVELGDGDRIELGNVRLVFSLEA